MLGPAVVYPGVEDDLRALPFPPHLELSSGGALASGSPVDRYPPSGQAFPHSSPTHRLSCQLLGGDGSHLERGPEDRGFSAWRMERSGGGGMGA